MKKTVIMFTLVLMLSVFAGSTLAGTEDTYNTFYGSGAGASITNDTAADTFIGALAGYSNTTGNFNNFIGYQAGYSNTTGYDNNFIGDHAGYLNTIGIGNNFIGGTAGYKTTGNNNTFIGLQSGYNSTAANANTFIGNYTGYTNTTGSGNTFLGISAGYASSTGTYDTFIGYSAGYNTTTGNLNNFIGFKAGYNNTTGTDNSFIGDSAGNTNTVENSNTLIGNSADIDGTTPGSVTNATAIGANAKVSQANSLVLGSIAGVNSATSSVNVGIGTSVPARQLHLVGSNAVFRMDRTADTAAFMLVRIDASGNPQKTFVVGANSSGSGVGTFVINDLGTAVSGGGTNRMTINNDGSVTFTGNVYANSFVPSSMAYKDNIRTYENALETVNKLRGVRFDWKDSGKPSVGLIAEEVAKVIPEVVAHNDGNAPGVNYASLVGVLVEAFKEQQGYIQELEAKHQMELKSLKEQQQQINTAFAEKIDELECLLKSK
jgi:microcompartment protein CcmK/EutM